MKSSRIRNINRRPCLTNIFYIEKFPVGQYKEATHYSIRVGDEVPGVVAVLVSPAEVTGLAVVSIAFIVAYCFVVFSRW